MHNGTAGATPARADDRDDIYHTVVADLASLIGRIQASMALIDAAVAREASAALQETAANVVVLDDVTPCYLKAGAALRACDAGLGVALHFLREPLVPELLATEPGTHNSTGSRALTPRQLDHTPHAAIN
jgi:hypothetical protein